MPASVHQARTSSSRAGKLGVGSTGLCIAGEAFRTRVVDIVRGLTSGFDGGSLTRPGAGDNVRRPSSGPGTGLIEKEVMAKTQRKTKDYSAVASKLREERDGLTRQIAELEAR